MTGNLISLSKAFGAFVTPQASVVWPKGGMPVMTESAVRTSLPAVSSARCSLGVAKYDALQAKLDHRFAAGYQIGAAFTWSHGRGYTDEDSGDSPNSIG